MSTPTRDPDSEPYWAALAEHRVVVQGCGRCGARFLPMMPGCARCGADEPETVAVSGEGTIYSHVTVSMPLGPGDDDRVPYSILTVDLDGGGRMFGRVVGGPPPRIGARVSPHFADRGGWTELCFVVQEEESQ